MGYELVLWIYLTHLMLYWMGTCENFSENTGNYLTFVPVSILRASASGN